MLQLSPVDCILFTSNNNEFIGNVEILNVSKKSVTYKVSLMKLHNDPNL